MAKERSQITIPWTVFRRTPTRERARVGVAGTGNLPAATALGTTQSLLSTDSLQEFRVEGSTYSAEYGHVPGGQFAMLSRSGANKFHGSLFDYLRNNYFDARDWFTDHYRQPQTLLRQNDFGGTVGGPITIPFRQIHDVLLLLRRPQANPIDTR